MSDKMIKSILDVTDPHVWRDGLERAYGKLEDIREIQSAIRELQADKLHAEQQMLDILIEYRMMHLLKVDTAKLRREYYHTKNSDIIKR